MKSTGITRKVDDLGRVVIPAGVRRNLGIREGDQVEVHVEGDQVILTKPVDACVFCRDEEDLQPYRDKVVCRSCVASVGVLDENLRRQRTLHPDPGPHVQAVPDQAEPRTQPLPSWTEEAGRPRPPLGAVRGTSAATSAPQDTIPTDPRPPAPDHGQRIEPSAPAQPAPGATQRDEPRHEEPAAGDRRDRRDDPHDPPASTAW